MVAGNVTSRRFSFEAQLAEAKQLLASKPAEALEHANNLTAGNPDPRAFRLAASALRALGRKDEAAEAELKAIKFGFTPPLQEAVRARESRQVSRSKAIAEAYLQANPGDLLAMTIAAEAAMGLRELDTSETLLRQVLLRAPGFPRAAFLLSNVLTSQLRMREAIEVMEDLRARLPQDWNAVRHLADLRAQRGDYSESAALYAEVVSAPSPSPADLFKYAHSLRAAGCPAESIGALRKAIEIAPLEGRAWWALAQYFPAELGDDELREIRHALERAGPQGSDVGLLQIALSIGLHLRGEYGSAFEAISSVKAARRPSVPYDADALTRHVDELIAAFTPELYARRASDEAIGTAPIFIVGMPRSGSTLVERILGCHSKIEGVGEIQVMSRLIDARQEGATGYSSLLPRSLSAGELASMAEWYLQRAGEFRRTAKPFFIDKYNANWIHSGLIRLMLPNARIIDVRRNPVDCCWSVFRMMYGDDYANDQRDLARYYADYVRLVEAIDEASPGGILTVRYEELVADPEGGTRRILDFLDLDFEPACVDFHLASGGVATPSSEQVRRPINRDSIGAATPYAKWLGPMIDELRSRGMLDR